MQAYIIGVKRYALAVNAWLFMYLLTLTAPKICLPMGVVGEKRKNYALSMYTRERYISQQSKMAAYPFRKNWKQKYLMVDQDAGDYLNHAVLH